MEAQNGGFSGFERKAGTLNLPNFPVKLTKLLPRHVFSTSILTLLNYEKRLSVTIWKQK
jgi:hypothetical protein